MTNQKNCKYAIVVPTSMGVRLTPVCRQPMHASKTFDMQATSAETNAATISSSLGLSVHALTAFVKDSPVSRFIRADLAARGITCEGREYEQGGPWGVRHQFNLADSGYGGRAPRVFNDRAGEVGRLLDAKDFDLNKLFAEDGVAVVHLTGLIAALSEQTGQFCLDVIREAKKHGATVTFDLNYRASFWKGRETQLRKIFTEIAGAADVLCGNEEDFQLCLGLSGPETGGKTVTKTDQFKQMITLAEKRFPGVKTFATTLRQVQSANAHLWGSILFSLGKFVVEEPRPIDVLDRIGGGDGFTGGLLYGLLQGWDAEKCNAFGWACGALAATSLTDYALPLDEKQVFSIYEGNARVVR